MTCSLKGRRCTGVMVVIAGVVVPGPWEDHRVPGIFFVVSTFTVPPRTKGGSSVHKTDHEVRANEGYPPH